MKKDIYDVYYLLSDVNESRGNIGSYNSSVKNNKFRTEIMTTAPLYYFIDGVMEKNIIGEIAISESQIESPYSPYVNVVFNNQINIYDKVIIPNFSSGFLYKSTGDEKTNIFYLPPSSITQDLNAQKVVIENNPTTVIGPEYFRILITVFRE